MSTHADTLRSKLLSHGGTRVIGLESNPPKPNFDFPNWLVPYLVEHGEVHPQGDVRLQYKLGTKSRDEVSESDERSLSNVLSGIRGATFTTDEIRSEFESQVWAALDEPEVWNAVERLAMRLQESDRVQGDEVREIVTNVTPR